MGFPGMFLCMWFMRSWACAIVILH
jgi:hypothetical protein